MKRTLELDRNRPRGQTILTSADAAYFNEFGPALFQSAAISNNNIHFNVIQPDTEAANLVLKMASRNSNNDTTFSFTYVDFLEEVDPKVYFASDRFFLARDLLALDPTLSVLTIDIDSVIINPIEVLDCDLGLSIRSTDKHLVKETAELSGLFAGMCFFSDQSLDFVHEATKHMDEDKFYNWFSDQHALWKTYQEYDLSEVDFIDFSKTKMMDWEFKSDTHLWTGKGPRKHTDPTYVEKVNMFTDKFLKG